MSLTTSVKLVLLAGAPMASALSPLQMSPVQMEQTTLNTTNSLGADASHLLSWRGFDFLIACLCIAFYLYTGCRSTDRKVQASSFIAALLVCLTVPTGFLSGYTLLLVLACLLACFLGPLPLAIVIWMLIANKGVNAHVDYKATYHGEDWRPWDVETAGPSTDDFSDAGSIFTGIPDLFRSIHESQKSLLFETFDHNTYMVGAYLTLIVALMIAHFYLNWTIINEEETETIGTDKATGADAQTAPPNGDLQSQEAPNATDGLSGFLGVNLNLNKKQVAYLNLCLKAPLALMVLFHLVGLNEDVGVIAVLLFSLSLLVCVCGPIVWFCENKVLAPQRDY